MPPPANLYKYGNMTEPGRLREILLDNKVWFSVPSSFNDPFDCRPFIEVGKTRQERRKAEKVVEDLLKKNSSDLNRSDRITEAKKIIKGILANQEKLMNDYKGLLDLYGVFCLTSKNDNLLMWSHYAYSHTGYCLEFSTRPRDSVFAGAEPVTYCNLYPIVYFDSSANEGDWGEGALCTKSDDWKYEDEWRLFNRDPGHLDFSPQLLTRIILGCKMDKEHTEQIKEWISQRDHPMTIEKARMSLKEFKLDIGPM